MRALPTAFLATLPAWLGLACAPAEAPPPAPFLQAVPGSLVELEMVPLPVEKGAAPLWIGMTEVPWDAYDVFYMCLDLPEEQREEAIDAESRPSKPYGAPDYGFGHEGFPAICVTRHAAEAFCRWLTESTDRVWRLPTEEEWERACGAAPADLAASAWTFENAGDRTHAVAGLAPNELGLYDMLGNVAEWCSSSSGELLVRGGCFNDYAKDVHPRARALQAPSWNQTDPQDPKSTWWLSDGYFIGFRLVCQAPASAESP